MLSQILSDREHNNSVRLKEDSCEGPARPIIIKADADLHCKSFLLLAVNVETLFLELHLHKLRTHMEISLGHAKFMIRMCWGQNIDKFGISVKHTSINQR